MPNNFFARHEFGDFYGAAVKILVMILKLGAGLVGITLNFFRPPAPNVVDGVKGFFRRVVDQKRDAEIVILFHRYLTFATEHLF